MVFTIKGKVISGRRLGRELGFPTANVAIGERSDIRDGVYAAICTLDGRRYEGMAYVGRKPSVEADPAGRVLEINIFGCDGDLYGSEIEVELLHFIRQEEKFADTEQLKKALQRDKDKVTQYFKTIKNVY